MSLYEEVLGAEFANLAESLQRLHREPFETTGIMEVSGRSLARWLGLPRPGLMILRMKVSFGDSGEVWERRFMPVSGIFAAWGKSTRQWQDGEFLVEKIGPTLFKFRLRVEKGFLVFEQVECRLFGIQVPSFLSLRIAAVEMDSGEFFTPLVSFYHPWFGHLCTYAGSIEYPWKSRSGSY